MRKMRLNWSVDCHMAEPSRVCGRISSPLAVTQRKHKYDQICDQEARSIDVH